MEVELRGNIGNWSRWQNASKACTQHRAQGTRTQAQSRSEDLSGYTADESRLRSTVRPIAAQKPPSKANGPTKQGSTRPLPTKPSARQAISPSQSAPTKAPPTRPSQVSTRESWRLHRNERKHTRESWHLHRSERKYQPTYMAQPCQCIGTWSPPESKAQHPKRRESKAGEMPDIYNAQTV